MPLNLPNCLTLFRIAITPVMVLLIALDEQGGLLPAAAVFGVAALTDVADGHVARSRNLITSFGRIADPVADKLLVGSALVSLAAVERIALWVVLVILVREAGVSALRWHANGQGIAIPVSALGKAKTGAQMTAIPALMLTGDPGAAWVAPLIVAVVAITVASGIGYALTYAREAAGGAAERAVARA